MEELSRNQQQQLRMMASEFLLISMSHLHLNHDFDVIYRRLMQIDLDDLHVLLSQD
ncbi:hypothetical protein [Synechococcus sp. MIT S1220]|uniref:hypothetical protein n=1 Tax=Synechococcus sp. MIT S1220 TaxID=3082549 RepID=UPI0039B0E001